MASTSVVAMAVLPSPSAAGRWLPRATSTTFFNPLKTAATGRWLPRATSTTFFNPLKTAATARLPRATGRFEVRASSSVKEQAVVGLTAAAMAAAFLVPDIAEAAQPGISPSLKNFLLSIVSGGVVLTAIIGAVIGVSNFDPVKRT